MSNNRIFPALLLAAAVMAGCSSIPKQNALLEEARNDYRSAQNNPNVVQLAAPELTNAGVALDQANAALSAGKDDETVNKLAYLAKQKIATTEEIAKRKAAELTVASAGKERDQLRLEQRTLEADKAKMDAKLAQSKVANAQALAIDANRQTAEAEAYSRQLEAMLADLSAKKTDRGMVITLGDVLFSIDQSQLRPDGIRNVQKLADFLKQFPQRTVLVEGNTDSTGSAEHNQELSNHRAEAVRATLESMGIARDRIAIRGYGEKYPVASNDTAEHRQLNRRVEIILSDENGHVAQR